MSGNAKGSPRVAVVIVNYRTAAMVIDHFAAVKAELERFPGSLAYIVDNASPGDDGEKLAAFAAAEPLAHFIQSPVNGGFGAGNNVALAEALKAEPAFDYFFLLNPDAYPAPGALAALVAFMEAHEEAGLVGPRVDYEDGRPQTCGFRFFSIAGEFEGAARTGLVSRLLARHVVPLPPGEKPREVDWLSGAALFVRRRTLEEIGLFDEGYFLYFEETDLALRARRAGWRVWCAPGARVIHHHGEAVAASEGVNAMRVASSHWRRSRAYYYRKNHGGLYAAAADGAFLAGAGLYYLRTLATGGDRKAAGEPIAQFFKGLREG